MMIHWYWLLIGCFLSYVAGIVTIALFVVGKEEPKS